MGGGLIYRLPAPAVTNAQPVDPRSARRRIARDSGNWPRARSWGWLPINTPWTSIVGACVAVVLVALPSSAGSSSTTAHHFRGTVSAFDTQTLSGCGTNGTKLPWNLNLSSGRGVAITNDRVVPCANATVQPGQHSALSGYDGVEALIPVKVRPGDDNVTVNISGRWNATVLASDGAPTGYTPHCRPSVEGLTLVTLYRTEELWSYSTTTGRYRGWQFLNQTEVNGVWSNYTHASGPPPNPFVLNHTTSMANYSYGEGYGSCAASASLALEVGGFLIDKTTGASYYAAVTVGGNGVVFIANVGVYAQTDWAVDSFRSWDGPKNLSYYSGVSPSSSNTSLASYANYMEYSNGSSTYGRVNAVAWSGSGNLAGALLWSNHTWPLLGVRLNPADRWVVELTVYEYCDAWTNWYHGTAGWRLDLGAKGNYFRVDSVTAY